MKALICVSLLTLFSAVSAMAAPDRETQVIAEFITQANSKDSEIGKRLQAAREEKANGFRSEEKVIPIPVQASDFKIVETDSDVYLGKIIGPNQNDREPGYENRTYMVYVPAYETWYGGRIEIKSTLQFSCSLHAIDYGAPDPTIQCKEVVAQ